MPFTCHSLYGSVDSLGCSVPKMTIICYHNCPKAMYFTFSTLGSWNLICFLSNFICFPDFAKHPKPKNTTPPITTKPKYNRYKEDDSYELREWFWRFWFCPLDALAYLISGVFDGEHVQAEKYTINNEPSCLKWQEHIDSVQTNMDAWWCLGLFESMRCDARTRKKTSP